jgi:plastocyanin
MQMRNLRRAGALAAVAAIGATGLVSAGAASGKAADSATINIVMKGKEPVYQGPTKIKAGSDLTITNTTDPQEIGPHSFTLADKSELPKTNQEVKDCFKLKNPFCVHIFEKHKVNFKKETVGKPSLEVGKKGWDTSFGKKGDSWVSLNQDESQTRVLSAKPGDTLYYFCVIHPFMQGKIKVVK